MKSVYIVAALALVFAVAGLVGAQETGRQCVVPSEMIDLGAGPFPLLEQVPDYLFNETYMLTMYQLNSDIAALAAYGLDNAYDQDIKVFSRKIALERIDLSNDLRRWYWQYNNRIMPKPDTARQEALLGALSGCSGQEFDRRYAELMIELMQQSEETAELAIETNENPDPTVDPTTTNLDLLFHARVTQRTNENEIAAFQRWLDTGSLR